MVWIIPFVKVIVPSDQIGDCLDIGKRSVQGLQKRLVGVNKHTVSVLVENTDVLDFPAVCQGRQGRNRLEGRGFAINFDVVNAPAIEGNAIFRQPIG